MQSTDSRAMKESDSLPCTVRAEVCCISPSKGRLRAGIAAAWKYARRMNARGKNRHYS